MIENIFVRNETIAQCHVNDMEFGRYFCKSGFMRGSTLHISMIIASNNYQIQPR